MSVNSRTACCAAAGFVGPLLLERQQVFLAIEPWPTAQPATTSTNTNATAKATAEFTTVNLVKESGVA